MKKLFALMVAASLAAIGCEDKKTTTPQKPPDSSVKSIPKPADPSPKPPSTGSNPKGEVPKAELPKADPPKVDPPKVDPPKVDPPKGGKDKEKDK